jgi:hypothetical protein
MIRSSPLLFTAGYRVIVDLYLPRAGSSDPR